MIALFFDPKKKFGALLENEFYLPGKTPIFLKF